MPDWEIEGEKVKIIYDNKNKNSADNTTRRGITQFNSFCRWLLAHPSRVERNATL
ncbi:hypothetical protein AGMMS50239_35520 [Bacteroidia bacterium]|nr:hypothetical protein AGMMS50239_35520 [Bacteroidia bacterium]